jgi:hypothetical protein
MNNKIFSDKGRSVIRTTSRIDETIAVKSAIKLRYMKLRRIINLLAVIIATALSPLTWAAPHGGGGGVPGGGHFGGGVHAGGFPGGISRAAPSLHGGGFRTAPTFQGAYFTGRSPAAPSRAPRFYYNGAGMPAVTSSGVRAVGNSPRRIAGRTSPLRSQPNRAEPAASQNSQVPNSQAGATNGQINPGRSVAGKNRASNPRTQTAASRQSFVKNHSSERHDANNWHRDWDRHHAHFHNNRVFVFIDGFWWGLYPWDYYPNYAYGYPYDYGNSYPYDYYNGYPDSSYDPSPYDNYQQPVYESDQYGNATTISAVQSELARLGYYRGAVDGVSGDETQAALANYQQDHDLSVTGTLTPATLRSLGLPQSAG